MNTQAYLPDDTRVYAIGDIHGGLNLLKKMMDAIENSEQTQLKKTRFISFFWEIMLIVVKTQNKL